MIKEIRIPEISENVTSGKVVNVLVETGDEVQVDDPIIEFETEKAVVEIPSPHEGRITEILVKEGDELKVGDVIAKVDTEKGASREESQAAEEKRKEPKAAEKEEAEAEGPAEEEPPEEKAEARRKPERGERSKPEEKKEPKEPEGRAEEEEETQARPAADKAPAPEADAQKRGPAPASPSVRRFARELGVDIHDVRPAEPGDRISEADVKAYVKHQRSAEGGRVSAPLERTAGPAPGLPDFSRWGEVERRELTGVRRLTAEKMAAAWQAVVHVTQFDRADISHTQEFMRRHGGRVEEQGGKLTITAVLMKVCAAALVRFPQFNASIDPEKKQLILKKYVHIGLAVDTPRGLLVPVVRDADRKTILELAVEIVDLAGRTRNKKIKPDEMEGGSFTISNQGGIGGTNFTPVVFWPQAAILGVSRASTEPVYLDGEMRPRRMLPLALSYDHRIADGADAARFLRWICASIEHPLAMHFD
jgi:pyruvate dehydrogenase E2 component (dihydrolipoamide acetyltransferase)